FQCKLDGGGYSACPSPKVNAGLAEGAHTFSVKASDAAGNLSSATSFAWTVDTVSPPDPVIDAHPVDPSDSSSASFAFHDAEAGGTFECALDGGGFAACTSPQGYSSLSDGIHTFSVHAKDGVGNLSGAATFAWAVDTTPPADPTLDFTPPLISNSASAS